MYRRTDSPCILQDFVPFGASALLPLNVNHKLLQQGTGTADHLLPLGCYYFSFFYWAAAPKGTKSCRTHGEFLSPPWGFRSPNLASEAHIWPWPDFRWPWPGSRRPWPGSRRPRPGSRRPGPASRRPRPGSRRPWPGFRRSWPDSRWHWPGSRKCRPARL